MKQELLTLIRELVAIDSVNPFITTSHGGREIGLGNETPINLYLEEKLAARGFSVSRQTVEQKQRAGSVDVPERYNVVAEKGTGTKSILFFAHVDTVDVKAGWKQDPFVVQEKTVDGRLCLTGLGTNDMKSGIAAILEAAKAEPPAGWKVKIAFLADEEFWSFGAVKLLESEFLNDVKLALVPEISEAGSSPFIQWLGLGRLGRTEFIFDVEGHACHGADAFVHPDAVNAAHEIIHLGEEITRYCQHARKTFQAEGISVVNSAYVNFIQGGKGILSVPDRASCVLDRALVPGETAEDELLRVLAFVEDVRARNVLDQRTKLKVSTRSRPTPPCKPYFFPPSNAVVRYVSKISETVAGQIEYGIGRSVADENRLAERGIPVVIVAPHGGGSHTSQEWVDAESVQRIADIFEKAISHLNSLE